MVYAPCAAPGEQSDASGTLDEVHVTSKNEEEEASTSVVAPTVSPSKEAISRTPETATKEDSE
jgi:hypothetical protein